MTSTFKRFMASTLVASTFAMGLPMQAQAGIIGTADIVSPAEAQQDRTQVQQFFAREDVQRALTARGVSADEALARVAAMTDAEVAQLADRIDQAPAGGEILGLLFTVFVILLVTDILGLTKVFPFTRSVR